MLRNSIRFKLILRKNPLRSSWEILAVNFHEILSHSTKMKELIFWKNRIFSYRVKINVIKAFPFFGVENKAKALLKKKILQRKRLTIRTMKVSTARRLLHRNLPLESNGNEIGGCRISAKFYISIVSLLLALPYVISSAIPQAFIRSLEEVYSSSAVRNTVVLVFTSARPSNQIRLKPWPRC